MIEEEIIRKTFLGFDFSTQRLKALVVGEDFGVLHEADVEFDVDLPEFRTAGGVVRKERGEVVAPPLLWVKALDMVLDRLVVAGVDFSTVTAISGAAQQHGSVWWAKNAESKLSSLSPDDFLHTQLSSVFLADSPVWMDSSTSTHCRALEEAVGGPLELAKITGSRAYERFTGPQIRKMYHSRPRVYQAAERISLVSSFACSLFLGKIAPIDLSDGSGMNLLDIHTKKWHNVCIKHYRSMDLPEHWFWRFGLTLATLAGRGCFCRIYYTHDYTKWCSEACGDEHLASKLGEPVPSWTMLGNISDYYVGRFGFNKDCQVVAFTGDNCSALAGLRLQTGWICLSLGTSDTLLLGLKTPAAPLAGNVLIGPTPEVPYMAMLVFSNGSVTRQNHRDRLVGASWDGFSELLRATVRGNLGYMGIYFDTAEIVPKSNPGRWLWDAAGRLITTAAPQFEARALLETQALARRAHAHDLQFTIDANSRLIATGGAAVNKELLQIFADVFNTPVYIHEEHGNAALFGACLRAAKVWSVETGYTLPEPKTCVSPVASPYPDAETIYTPMLKRYRELVSTIPTLL